MRYIGEFRHGGGFGGGYGGTYTEEMPYESRHRRGSKANEADAVAAWKRRHGRTGWVELVSSRLER